MKGTRVVYVAPSVAHVHASWSLGELVRCSLCDGTGRVSYAPGSETTVTCGRCLGAGEVHMRTVAR